MTLQKTKNGISLKGTRFKEFEVSQRLRQGDPLTTTLFNLVLEMIMRKCKIKMENTILKNEHRCIAFADNNTCKNKKEMKRVARRIVKKQEDLE